MSTVDQGYAAWLKSDSLTQSVYPPAPTSWAAQGQIVTETTPFATVQGAGAEGARVLAFLGGPLVQDAVLVDGARADLVGRCIMGAGGGLDYDPAGETLYVLGAQEQDDVTTLLTVLRRLR